MTSEPSNNRRYVSYERTKALEEGVENLLQDLDACRAELAAATAREASLRDVLRELAEAAGEMKHRRLQAAWRAAFALLAEPDTTSEEASQ